MRPASGSQVNPLKAAGMGEANVARGLSRALEKAEDLKKKCRLHPPCYTGTSKQQELSVASRVPASGAMDYC